MAINTNAKKVFTTLSQKVSGAFGFIAVVPNETQHDQVDP